jgi:hypothetical protein
MRDCIELLSESLIDQHPDLALEVLAASSKLGLSLGWHYVLDLVWLLRELDLPRGATVLDAGAGWGLAQFLFADRGLRVISVDMSARQARGELQHLYNFERLGSGATIHHRYLERARPNLKTSFDLALATPLGQLPGKVLNRLGWSRATAAPATVARPGNPSITLYQAALEAMDAAEHDAKPPRSRRCSSRQRGAPGRRERVQRGLLEYLSSSAGFTLAMLTWPMVQCRSDAR